MLTELVPGAPDDFDFEIGDWEVKHRRLKERLKGCNEWEEFDGESSTKKILGGFGNLEDNLLHFPALSFRAIALRSYNAETKKWSIWWLDGRFPDSLDTPVVGEFSNGVGLFFADEILEGMPIKIRFKWELLELNQPRWEQAFSADGGATWETNWTMDFFPKAKI
ncbi:MAG: DUF1579 domain-containing protein [Anaerolineales bacterium]|nr:DUF1579 domain-containing protein [Anaerolineales bacterium]